MPPVIVSHSRYDRMRHKACFSQAHFSEQNPAKAGGVVAPKPPHSMNSSSVLPPEPPVLVSESHSGHCTDFLKVVAFVVAIDFQFNDFSRRSRTRIPADSNGHLPDFRSGFCCIQYFTPVSALTLISFSPVSLPVSLCTPLKIPIAGSVFHPRSLPTADRQAS